MVRIGPSDESFAITQSVNSSFKQKGWKCYSIDRGEQYYIHLPDSIEEYKSKLSKKMLSNLRRATKKLQTFGKLQFIKYNKVLNEEWRKVIRDCSEVEKNSWLDQDSNGKMRIHAKEDFWNRLLQDAQTSNSMVAWVLYLDDQPIAYDLTVDAGGCRYGISSQFDSKYRQHSVGLLIHICSIDGDSGYKARLGSVGGSHLIDYIYFRPSFIGQFIYTGVLAYDKIKKLGKNLANTITLKIPSSLLQALSK